MTLYQLHLQVVAALKPSLGEREARATARLLFEDDLNINPTKLILNGEREMEPETLERFNRYVKRISDGEPPQLVLGKAHFMGLTLEVTHDTLIPRPETAGLIDIITDDWGEAKDVAVLDIGTGSGCIALALARALPFSKVEALDISSGALSVACRNAKSLNADIKFIHADILRTTPPAEPLYDIIVSNPPYIANREKAEMDNRVVMHEPHTALFVDDNAPLLFYEAISKYALRAIKPGGKLYFEINPLFAKELQQMLNHHGWSDVEIYRDYVGKQRFAKACR